MAERPRLLYRTLLLWLVTVSVIGYALVEEYRTQRAYPDAFEGDSDPDTETDKLRIVAARPSELAPGAAVFVRVAGIDERYLDQTTVEIAKEPAEVLRRSADQLIVRVPSTLAYGQVKLRVLQVDRRSKGWTLTLRPLPGYEILRNVVGGLALFVLGLRTMARSLRAYAGRRVRGALAQLTHGWWRPIGLGVLIGLLTQSTTSAAGLFAGLLAAHMLKLRAAVVLLVGAQLGTAIAAVILPLLATREALWVITIGALWVTLAENRLSRALGSVVVGAGLIFHGLGLLQAGCAPLISDPQVVPYLSYLQADSLLGVLRCAGAGAALSALLQGPSPAYALVLNLLQDSGLETRDGLAILAGVSMGAFINTLTAAWSFAAEGRRLLRVQLVLCTAMTVISLAGLPLYLQLAAAMPANVENMAARWPALMSAAQAGLGVPFLASQLIAALCALLMLPVALRANELWSLRKSLRPTRQRDAAHSQALLRALALCESGLRGVREIITSADRSSAPATERALSQAKDALRDSLRAHTKATDDEAPPTAANVAGLHLADALLACLRVSEKAPELGLSPSAEGARALEQLHGLVERALSEVHQALAENQIPSLTQAQAREIEINAFEAATRRQLFEEHGQREDLALRLWSSELCSAYENVGNQVYRLANAVGAQSDDV